MMAIAKMLAESKAVNHAIRKNIYIHGVECTCESYDKKTKTRMDGKNCFCAVNVDLLGTNKIIRTHETQPTGNVSIEIDPVNFTKYADAEEWK